MPRTRKPLIGPDGQVIKRKPGRPKKNPVVALLNAKSNAEIERRMLEVLALSPEEYKRRQLDDIKALRVLVAEKLRSRIDEVPAGTLATVYGILTDKELMLGGVGSHVGTQINIQVNGVAGGRDGLVKVLKGRVQKIEVLDT